MSIPDKIPVPAGRDIITKKFLRYRFERVFARVFSAHSVLELKKCQLNPS
jgi:hypothetical protein